MVFRHVFTLGIQCPANTELSMIKVKDFIHYLKYELGWNIAGVSFDGYQSLMLIQSLMLDGFMVNNKPIVTELSMDVVKNKECVGYTIFRNTLVEKRVNLIPLPELTKEITNLEKEEETGKIDHPKQSVTTNPETGEKIKSVGKDEVDSLSGAIYNATISVDMGELDYLDNVIVTGVSNSSMILDNTNSLNRKFGFRVDSKGIVHMEGPSSKNENITNINDLINDEIKNLKKGIDINPEARPVPKNTGYIGRSDGMIII